MKNTPNIDPAQSIIKSLSRLDRKQKHFANQALMDTPLKGAMYKYILTLGRHPGVSQEFLAEFHAVDKSRVARVARELEFLGYISRLPDENDRRHFRLSLTESGTELYYKIQSILAGWGNLISAGIPDDAMTLTVDTLSKMIDNIDKM